MRTPTTGNAPSEWMAIGLLFALLALLSGGCGEDAGQGPTADAGSEAGHAACTADVDCEQDCADSTQGCYCEAGLCKEFGWLDNRCRPEGDDERCASGYCDPDTAVCVSEPGRQMCDTDADCDAHLECADSFACFAPLGGHCDDDGDCSGMLECFGGFRNETFRGTCLVGRGADCNDDGECGFGMICIDSGNGRPQCSSGTRCSEDADCTVGSVCQASLCEAGVRCDVDSGCERGTCNADSLICDALATGEPCTDDQECAVGACRASLENGLTGDKTCVAPDGTACAEETAVTFQNTCERATCQRNCDTCHVREEYVSSTGLERRFIGTCDLDDL